MNPQESNTEANGKTHEQLQAEEAEILFGKTIEVTFENPKNKPEQVTIRKVSLRNMGRYSSVIGNNEAAEIGLYTGCSEDWADSLSEESAEQVLSIGRALSKKRYSKFAERSVNFGNQIMDGSPALAKLAAESVRNALQSRLGGAFKS